MQNRRWWARVLAAVVPVAAATGLCWGMRQLGGSQAPFILFLLAALLAGWYGGLTAGLLALAAGEVLGDYVFLSPPRSLDHHGQAEILLLLTYVIATFVSLLLLDALRREHARARAAAVEAHARASDAEREMAERRKAEQTLVEAEAKYRCLVEESLVGVYLIQDGRFVYVNGRMAEIFGYDSSEIVGRSVFETVAPEHRDLVMENLRKRQNHEVRSIQYAFRGLRKDGQTVDVEVVGTTTIYNGKTAVIGSLMDVTDRKAAEAELRKAKEMAEAASRAKDHFLAVLSHELRTPLTPVLAAAGMMLSDPGLPADVADHVRMIHRNVELEATLIDDLLDLTRIARGKIELSVCTVELRELWQRTIDICWRDIEAKQLRLQLDVDGGPSRLRGDPARLQQVFWNLLRNAIKFTPDGGSILVRCSAGNACASRVPGVECSPPVVCPAQSDGQRRLRSAIIEISDTGIGMDPCQIDRLFSAFEQADRSITRRFGGLGLGLAICKALVEMHGGVITATSAGKGRGSTFRIELPLCEPDLPPCGSDPISPLLPARITGSGAVGPGQLLLVEDHPDTARVVAKLLRMDGYVVEVAHDLASARALARERSFDLLISDLGLPDGSGLDLLRELRSAGSDLPAIAISGFGMDEDIRQSHEAGFAEHLTKPVSFDALHAAVARVKRTSPCPACAIGDLSPQFSGAESADS